MLGTEVVCSVGGSTYTFALHGVCRNARLMSNSLTLSHVDAAGVRRMRVVAIDGVGEVILVALFVLFRPASTERSAAQAVLEFSGT